MAKKIRKVWINDDFAKELKIWGAEEKIPVTDLTEKLAENIGLIKGGLRDHGKQLKLKRGKRYGFDF